ncbi:MAG: beta strand repeat-containing protein [Acidimicrobiales bacterium]
MPTVSNLNFSSGETVANLVTVPLSATGGVTIYNSAGSTDVVADVEGYYTSTPSTNGSGLYNAISPVRVLGALSFGAPVAANTSVPVTVTGTLTGVPATATAVVANVTAEGATLPSFLTVYPAGATMPVASNLNFPAQAKNVAIANRVKIGIGTNGQIEVYNHSGTVNVDVDVDGYYTGAGGTGSYFVPITPVRLADTRTTSLVGTETPIAASTSESFLLATTASGIPATATAVEANFTVVPGDANGYLTVYPGTSTTTVPVASDVNWVATNLVPRSAQGIPNFDIADTAGSGSVEVYNSHGATINLVIDAFGYFMTSTAPTTAFTVTPESSTTTSVGTGVTYTVTGLTAANCPTGLANLSLFPAVGADAPTAGGVFSPTTGPTFVPENGAASGQHQTTGVEQGNTALGTFNAGAGYIAAVNGVSTAGPGTWTVAAISATAGTFTFTLNSSVADSTIPVVFCEPVIASVLDSLQVLASGIPENGYPVGVGGATTWQAAPAPAGNYYGWTVESDPAGTFVACAGPDSEPVGPVTYCFTFNDMAAGDTFFNYSPNSALLTIPLSQAQFAADLSGAWPTDYLTTGNDWWNSVPGDVLSISYNPTGVSSFSFPPVEMTNGLDYPAAPTNVTATTGGVVSWTAVPNQNVSGDTTLGLSTSVRAQYLIFRQTLVAGIGTGWSCIGSTLPGGFFGSAYGNCPIGGNEVSATPPPTSFTDTSIVAGTTYVYAVVAVSNWINTMDDPLYGPPSAESASVTIPTSTATVPVPLSTNAAWAPISNTSLISGTSLTVDFNEPVTLGTGWSLTVADGAGDSAVVNSGDGTATVQTGPAGANTAILYTLTSSPEVISGVDPVLAGMEITGQAGVTATGCTATECAWNIIGSGPSTGNPSIFPAIPVSRTFETFSGFPGQNFVLPESPYVSSETAPNSLVVTCEDGPGSINVYDANGVALGIALGGTCTGSSQTVTTSTAFASGAALYVSQSTASYPESLATFTGPVLTFSPSPIAPQGTLGNNQGVTVTATVTTLGSPDPNASVDLEFVSSAALPGTASVAGTTLLPTAQSFTTNASGQIAIHYTSSGSSTAQFIGIDTVKSIGFGEVDIYNYGPAVVVAITGGPGVTAGENPTTVTQPTWTGTATTASVFTIFGASAVECSIDGVTTTPGTITGGPGTDSVTWSWTAPSPVVDGSHTVSCNVTDSDSNTGYSATVDWTETGNALAITSLSSGLTAAPYSLVSGPADGGNNVVITGTGFGDNHSELTVTFGGVAASSFVINSNTQITAVPAGGTDLAVGGAEAQVTNAYDTPGTPLAYTYVGPQVQTVAGANGGASLLGTFDPGDTITITYSEAMNPATMGIAGLSAGGPVTLPVSLLSVLGATGTLGSFVTAPTGTDTVDASLNSAGTVLTLTLVAVNGAAPAGNFTPNAGVRDNKTNAELTTTVTPTYAF